jgi:lipoyl(octanoyl) transferase
MDLSPYAAINPCGYEGMAVTQLSDLVAGMTVEQAAEALAAQLETKL